MSFALKENYSPETIEFLLRLGAEFQACESDLDRYSPFAVAIDDDYGAKEHRLALIEILIKAGYDLQLTDSEDLTPLAYAIEKENLPAIEKLLELGVKPTEEESERIEDMRRERSELESEQSEEMLLDSSELESEQIEQIKREGSKRIRHEEPLDEEAVEEMDTLISGIRKATNLTVAKNKR